MKIVLKNIYNVDKI